MKRGEAEDQPESDAFAGAPHPRLAETLVGHKAAEATLLSAYRDGRLAHAWLIGGAEGIGKATLAWRFARFLLANPDPGAERVREARDLHVDPNHPAARQLAALAHPDFALVRREWRPSSKKLRHRNPRRRRARARSRCSRCRPPSAAGASASSIAPRTSIAAAPTRF